MFRIIADVDFFETKLNRLYAEATGSDADSFDIYKLGKKIGLDDTEIESIRWHLQRGGLLKRESGSDLFRFSDYARMIWSGQIREAYAPI